MKKSRILRITGITLLILVVPLVGMWPLDEFDWVFADFAIIGSIIFGYFLARVKDIIPSSKILYLQSIIKFNG
jgi:hypothetical protein